MMKLIFLGSGTSHGVPTIGCSCPVCRSPDRFDKRTRASLYIKGCGGERLVIDTGPEFRIQALMAGITRLDGALLTHAHADHLHGLDDVRPLCWEKPLRLYGSDATLKEVRARFAYVFENTWQGGGKPRLKLIPAAAPFRIGGLTLTPIPVKHGKLDILGWKIQEASLDGNTGPSMVYLTDTSHIPSPSLPLLGCPELLIIGALRIQSHATHFSFGEALDMARLLKSRRTYLTHISHNHTHQEIETYCDTYKQTHLENYGLGETINPAYDGLELEL